MPPFFMLPMLFALMAFPPLLVVLLRLDPLLRTIDAEPSRDEEAIGEQVW